MAEFAQEQARRASGVRLVRPTNPFTPFPLEQTEQSIPDRFAQQVRQHPGRLALKAADEEMTYQALDRRTNRLAQAILESRGRTQEPVAFLLGGRGAEVLAIFAILKAGKSYVPLDPSFPAAHLQAVLANARPGLLLTDSAHEAEARSLSGGACPVLNLDALGRGEMAEDLGVRVAAEAPACLLYTSGSTGRPRGVLQNHRNLLYYVALGTNDTHTCPEDRLSGLASCGFAASVMDIFLALLNGAALLPFDVRRQGVAALVRWLSAEEITVYHSVPTLVRHVIAALTGAEKFPRLRLVRLGGEPLSRKDVELCRRHFGPDCLLANGLGASEMLAIRRYVLDGQTQLPGATVPVGYPHPGVDVRLLDEQGREVRPGEVGEITVKSRYLAPGYWNDPELTGRAFVPAPEGDGVRVYRTGDLGRLLPDGCLEHLGRKDHQLKVRGYRIEAEAVENVLRELDGVREAAVVGRKAPSGELVLAAYLVAAGPVPTPGAMRSVLQQRLPLFMVPSAFIFLPALPLTPSGKVDRAALPALTPTRPELGVPYVAPRTPAEAQLAAIWAEVFGLDRVGVQDDFFDLGGDSLLAGSIVPRVRKQLGQEIAVATVFERPTVEKLALHLLQRQAGTSPQLDELLAELEALPEETES